MNESLPISLDPGSTHTAYVVWNGSVHRHGYEENGQLLAKIRALEFLASHLANIEMIGHYGCGMPAGKDVFHTCLFIGRLLEAFRAADTRCRLILRPTIKTHLCGSARAKDQNVRQALLDKLGPVGTKKNQGPLYGISSHKWAALAVAIYASETEPKPEEMAFNL